MCTDMGIPWTDVYEVWTAEQMNLHSHVWLMRKELEQAQIKDERDKSKRRKGGRSRAGEKTGFHYSGPIQGFKGPHSKAVVHR